MLVSRYIWCVLSIFLCFVIPGNTFGNNSVSSDRFLLNKLLYVCGNRIREVIRNICPITLSRGYYTPGNNPLTQKQILQQNLQMDSQLESNNAFATRLRREIVKECCKKPCFGRSLLKYCNQYQKIRNFLHDTEKLPSTSKNNHKSCTCRRKKLDKQNLKSKRIKAFSIPILYVPYTFGDKFPWLNISSKEMEDESKPIENERHSRRRGGMEVITEAPLSAELVSIARDHGPFFK